MTHLAPQAIPPTAQIAPPPRRPSQPGGLDEARVELEERARQLAGQLSRLGVPAPWLQPEDEPEGGDTVLSDVAAVPPLVPMLRSEGHPLRALSGLRTIPAAEPRGRPRPRTRRSLPAPAVGRRRRA